MQRCDTLVDFEKCWKMRLLSLSEVSIQPRTSPPKYSWVKRCIRVAASPELAAHVLQRVIATPFRNSVLIDDIILSLGCWADTSKLTALPARIAMMASILFVTWRTLDGPFSAVSRPTIARLDAFFSIFQNLHVVRSFAPLETQFFAKKSSLFSANFAIHRCKTRFHDEFFDEFWRNLDEFWRNFDERWRILTNSD